MKIDFKKAFFLLCRTCVALIFIYASIDKIAHPQAFARIVHNYRLLPDFAVNLFSIWLPWIELLCGTLLLFGLWEFIAITIIAALMILFLTALGINTIRGLDISCGCFTTQKSSIKNVFIFIIRDLLIMIPIAITWCISLKKYQKMLK